MQVSAPWPDDVKLGEVIWGQMGLKFKDLLEHCESTILTVKRAISDFFIRKKVSNSDIYFTFCFPRIFYSQIQQGERSLWYLEMRENMFFRSFWGPFLTWIVKMFKSQRSRFSRSVTDRWPWSTIYRSTLANLQLCKTELSLQK